MEKWRKNAIYIAIGIASILLSLLIGISIMAPYLVKDECVMEAGRELTLEKVIDNPFVRFMSSVQQQPDLKQLGRQEVIIRVGVQNVTTEVVVKDRMAPKVTLREVSVLNGNACKIDSFVVNIEDATDTTLEYIKEPSFSIEGIQKVKIKVTDKAGNETISETKLIVVGT